MAGREIQEQNGHFKWGSQRTQWGISIAMFDYQRVTPSTPPINSTRNMCDEPRKLGLLHHGCEPLGNSDDPVKVKGYTMITKSSSDLLENERRKSGDLRKSPKM